jgi:lysozyme
MIDEDLAALRQQLIVHEGLRLMPYEDGAGKLTIGVGHNLTDRGITHAQAMALLDDDIADTVSSVFAAFPWTATIPAAPMRVLLDVAFNAGTRGLGKFVKLLAAVEAGDYQTAAAEVVNSHLAPARAQRLAALLRAA